VVESLGLAKQHSFGQKGKHDIHLSGPMRFACKLLFFSEITMICLRSSDSYLVTRRISKVKRCLFASESPSTSASASSKLATLDLAASRFGLDPNLNRFHSPIVNHERYSFEAWPSNHTFPMGKFGRIAYTLKTTCAKNTPGSNLPRPLVRQEEDFFRPLDLHDVPREWFSIIDDDFVDRFLAAKLTKEEARYIGFREQTNRPELIERTVLEVAGTVLTSQLAYHYGVACNVAGGTHHAHQSGGAGYTILNDLAVAANFLTDETLNQGSVRGIQKVLVIDCDVHQGDGTAKFSTEWSSERLSTMSLHCASNYPRLKANSTYDIGLRDGCEDDEYMEILEKNVIRAICEIEPDFVLYDAGVDIFEHDSLGRLRITESGIRRRDRWVLEQCVSSGIPVAAVVGGGYDKDVDALARRHAILHEECAYVWRKYQMWKR
jgi:acetoin utilization deacetylase AcuC-like enzyme